MKHIYSISYLLFFAFFITSSIVGNCQNLQLEAETDATFETFEAITYDKELVGYYNCSVKTVTKANNVQYVFSLYDEELALKKQYEFSGYGMVKAKVEFDNFHYLVHITTRFDHEGEREELGRKAKDWRFEDVHSNTYFILNTQGEEVKQLDTFKQEIIESKDSKERSNNHLVLDLEGGFILWEQPNMGFDKFEKRQVVQRVNGYGKSVWEYIHNYSKDEQLAGTKVVVGKQYIALINTYNNQVERSFNYVVQCDVRILDKSTGSVVSEFEIPNSNNYFSWIKVEMNEKLKSLAFRGFESIPDKNGLIGPSEIIGIGEHVFEFDGSRYSEYVISKDEIFAKLKFEESRLFNKTAILQLVEWNDLGNGDSRVLLQQFEIGKTMPRVITSNNKIKDAFITVKTKGFVEITLNEDLKVSRATYYDKSLEVFRKNPFAQYNNYLRINTTLARSLSKDMSCVQTFPLEKGGFLYVYPESRKVLKGDSRGVVYFGSDLENTKINKRIELHSESTNWKALPAKEGYVLLVESFDDGSLVKARLQKLPLN